MKLADTVVLQDKVCGDLTDYHPPAAKNMLTTGIYDSGHKKRKTKDNFQTGIASSYDDEVVVRKKPRVATPKRYNFLT